MEELRQLVGPALGVTAGALVVWGAMRQKLKDNEERLKNLEEKMELAIDTENCDKCRETMCAKIQGVSNSLSDVRDLDIQERRLIRDELQKNHRYITEKLERIAAFMGKVERFIEASDKTG